MVKFDILVTGIALIPCLIIIFAASAKSVSSSTVVGLGVNISFIITWAGSVELLKLFLLDEANIAWMFSYTDLSVFDLNARATLDMSDSESTPNKLLPG